VRLPLDEPSLHHLLAEETAQVKKKLVNYKNIEDICNSPEMTDEDVILIMKLLMQIWSPSYVLGLRTLVSVVSVKATNYTLSYGICGTSSLALVNYSFVYHLADLNVSKKEAYNVGLAGIQLSHKYKNLRMRAKCYYVFGTASNIWMQPIRTSYFYLDKSFEMAVQHGDFATAG
jgi:predicted ATPase